MKVYLGTDHAGFEYKEKVKTLLEKMGNDVVDCGAFEFNRDDDYPDFISKASENVSNNPGSMGIVFGGSGQGEAMVANKYKGVRAAVYNCENLELVKLSREHNDANILSIGARFISEENANQAVKLFLETPFTSEERHARRIQKIEEIENRG